MREKIRTVPNLAAISSEHQAAIAAGDEYYRAWQYNVADRYKGQTVEEIKFDLQKTAFPFAVCMENWISDFNFSSLVRNANGFNAKIVYYLGDKKVDRRGMVGVQNYTDIQWLPTIDELLKLKDKFCFVGIDNVPGSVSLVSYRWAPHTLMIFGSEGTGLTPTIQSMCKDIVAIPMMGSVRSFNCASASAVAMYDYIVKYNV